jgi:hypothetical protein
MESLVSDIPAGDWDIEKLFHGVSEQCQHADHKVKNVFFYNDDQYKKTAVQ